MTKRFCEDLVQRPGQVEGWTDWGYLQDTAQGPQFVSLNYGLESHLDLPTAFYHLAAAGLCEVRGQHLTGQLVAEEPPTLTPDPSVAVQVAHEPPPPIPAGELPPADDGLSVGGALAYGAVVVLIAVLALFSNRRTKAADTTPRPSYPDIFNQEETHHDR